MMLEIKGLKVLSQQINQWKDTRQRKLNSLLWCCLFFNFTQFVILESLSIFDLALSGVCSNEFK